MEEEGQWSTSHIILGLVYDTSSLKITLPESNRAGARVLFDSILAERGSTRIGVNTLQQIRGCMEHFKSTSAIWRLLTSPLEKLLTYADEIGEWITCPKEELWGGFLVANVCGGRIYVVRRRVAQIVYRGHESATYAVWALVAEM